MICVRDSPNGTIGYFSPNGTIGNQRNPERFSTANGTIGANVTIGGNVGTNGTIGSPNGTKIGLKNPMVLLALVQILQYALSGFHCPSLKFNNEKLSFQTVQ